MVKPETSPNRPPSFIHIPSGWEAGYSVKGGFVGRKIVRLLKAEQSIDLTPGIHLLTARNGRGKTTMLRTIAGLLPPLSGRSEHCGQIQYLGENLKFDPELCALKIFKAMFKRGKLDFAVHLSQDLDLDIHQPYGKLSTGNQQKTRLIVAESAASDAFGHILLLDEPVSNLDHHVCMRLNEHWAATRLNLLRIICIHELERAPGWDSLMFISGGQMSQILPGECQTPEIIYQRLG